MKKSMSVILLGSALLLSNNNNAEASYQNNDVDVQPSLKTIQKYVVTKGQFNSEYEVNEYISSYIKELEKAFGEYPFLNGQKPSVKPDQPVKPNEQQKPVTPNKPVEEQKPVAPEKPVEPQKPVTPPQTPSDKPVEQQPPVNQEQNQSISAVEQAVLNLTNAERQKAGLQPLQIDNKLMNSARQKSTDMATKNYFSHTSPTYGSPFDQMKANGISYKSAAENIAMGQRSAEEVVKGWMESPGHRQNILTPEFTHIGIGYDANGNYWTQQFIQK
ncbi:CAP domain-containing protein [Sporosarcina quadrami]|nr:CAP domain-containing protein [Sporosarcina quadrami]